MRQINDKLVTASHIFTQGSSVELFQPEVFSRPIFKHMVLYKRMAYCALYNTIVNMHTAKKTNSWFPLLTQMGFGSLFAGKALMQLNESLFGVDVPNENDPWWEQAFQTLWKGEFMGLASEIFNPDRSLENLTNAAIIDNAILLGSQIVAVVDNTATGTQALDKYMKRTSAIYNNVRKVQERKLNPYNRGYLKFRELYKKYDEKFKPDRGGDIDISPMERTPYYKDFTTAFNQGTNEDFAKQYWSTWGQVFNDKFNEYREKGLDYKVNTNQAAEYADSILKQKLTILNPNKRTAIDHVNKRIKRVTKATEIADLASWKRYLTPEQQKELSKLEAQYAKKRSFFENNKIKSRNKYMPSYKELTREN